MEGDAFMNEPNLEMKLDLNVLQHLGLRNYSSLPAVISEYVANAWDAGATRVKVEVPQETMNDDYRISIRDNGFGMNESDLNDKFLVVGRNRREEEGKDVVKFEIDDDSYERPVMGRKGIGKLAGFGVAGKVIIKTFKNGRYIEFELNYEKMRKEAEKSEDVKTDYEPKIVD